jgi:drug/metabolite transporter (DMT)-like permease
MIFIMGKPSECIVMPGKIWVILVVSGVLSIAASHVMYYSSIKRIGATIPALSLLSSPFIVFAISNVLFKEELTTAQWLWGIVLIVGAACAIFAQGAVRGKTD